MARKGSPGVAIKIEDRSGYSFIDTPSLIGGVVGYSPKGEFNKVLKITNTANQDSILGLGFNQAKWNMGMYATRAVLNHGGHVHFVRPYGEQVEKSDVRKSDLKSDAFVVSFDRNAARSDYYDKSRTAEENKTDSVHTSFDIRHFAATRYIADGFSGFGGKRKINTIQETIAENSNVDFQLTAGEEFNEEGKPSDVRSDSNMVLFALVNSDPTAANRAGDRYTATVRKNANGANKRSVTLVCDSVPAFTAGDVIYFPASNFVASESGAYATVTKIVDTQVVAEYDAEMDNVPTIANKTTSFFCNNDDASTGVDYVEVKTAVANRAVKKYGEMDYVRDENGNVDFSKIKMGCPVVLREPNGGHKVTRIIGLPTEEAIDEISGSTFEFTPKKSVMESGDTIKFVYTDGDAQKSFTGIVESVTVDGKVSVNTDEAIGKTVNVTSYEIVAVGKESCDAAASIATLNVNSSRPNVLNDIELGSVKWDETDAAKLVATFDSEVDAANFMAKVNGEDTVVATFDDDSTEEYVGVNVSGPASYSVESETYTVTLVFPEQLPSKPTKLAARGMVDVGSVSTGDVIQVSSDGNPHEYYVVSASGAGAIALSEKNGSTASETDKLGDKIINLTATTANILAAFNAEGFAINTYIGNNASQLTDASDRTKYNTSATIGVQLPSGTSTQYNVGDLVVFAEQKTNTPVETKATFVKDDVYEVKSINTFKDIVILNHNGDITFDPTSGNADKFGDTSEWKLVNLTESNANIWLSGKDGLTINMLGAYDLTVPASVQEEDFLVSGGTDDGDGEPLNFAYTSSNGGVIQRTDKLLVSDDVGASFNAMGLASVKYEDVKFNGTAKQVYALSAEGESIARMYLYITYHFNGNDYEMEGTVVPYVHDDSNLYIGDVADSVLTNSGARLLMNDSGILDNFLTNNSYDLSQSVEDGRLDSVSTMLAYDERDPAIVHDAIWEYSPANNGDSATLANAWNLFLDKDGTDVSMLIGAGTGVKNLFMKNRETLDGTVISAILNVCELRKDCFAILDGVGEANIETTLKKMIGSQGFGVKGRWGAIYDGRGVFFDSYYTLMNVEVVKSVQMASIITANSANGIWWLPPAGEINAVVPTEWGATEKYPRTFKYPEDTDSDIARLTEIRVNPTRYNSRGMFIWGDFTMQKDSTAFDQIHVAMLLAGIHKMFYHYLDRKVFQLNTTNLRTNIQSDLQAQLDAIMNANPSGLYSGTAICDDTNNTADVIDRNELHVDLRLKPTKTSRWITLRTIVESNGSSNNQTTSLYV